MKARFRGHHLICLHFYHGIGYSEDFIDALEQTLKNAQSSAIVILRGPDDVCLMCPHLKDERCTMDAASEDEVNSMDQMALSLLNLDIGQEVRWEDIRKKLGGFLQKWYEANCVTCFWKKVCGIEESPLINNVI